MTGRVRGYAGTHCEMARAGAEGLYTVDDSRLAFVPAHVVRPYLRGAPHVDDVKIFPARVHGNPHRHCASRNADSTCSRQAVTAQAIRRYDGVVRHEHVRIQCARHLSKAGGSVHQGRRHDGGNSELASCCVQGV